MALPLLTTLLQAVPAVTATISATNTPSPTVQIDPSIFKPLPGLLVPLQILALLITLALSIGIPVLVMRRFGIPLRNMLWGAIVGFAGQSVLAPLIVQLVAGGIGIPNNPDAATTLGLYVLSGVALAIVITAGYYLIYQFVFKYEEERSWAGAVMLGAGAFSLGVALNLLVSSLSNLAFFLQWPPKPDFIAPMNDDQRNQLIETAGQVAKLSGWEPLLTTFFSIATLLMLIVSAVMVWKFIQTRNWQWLAISALLLFLMPGLGIGVLVDYFLSDPLGSAANWLVGIIYLAVAALGVYLVFRLYEPPPVPAAVVAGPVVTKAEDQVMADHPELEESKVTKRKRRR